MGDLGTLTSNYLNSAYSGKKVFVTGDTGFKGSWLSIWLKMLGAKVYGFSLDPKTEKDNFVRCSLLEKINHFTGDIRNKKVLQKQIEEIKPEYVFHLAAQPLVLESYNNPIETFETNIMGTVNVLDIIKNVPSVKVAVIITTDKVYENNELDLGYKESDRLGGKDPYSASKAASELVVNSYRSSFFNVSNKCKIATTRAGNVIGGGDWAENRIVPDFIRSIQSEEKIVLRNPFHSRPWEHVLEPLGGYLLLAAKMFNSDKEYDGAWNFGPLLESDYSVKDLVQHLINSFGKGEFECGKNLDKPFESSTIRLDITKAHKLLNWKPILNFEETIEFTVNGYKDELNNGDLFQKRVNQIEEYIVTAQNKNIEWLLN